MKEGTVVSIVKLSPLTKLDSPIQKIHLAVTSLTYPYSPQHRNIRYMYIHCTCVVRRVHWMAMMMYAYTQVSDQGL